MPTDSPFTLPGRSSRWRAMRRQVERAARCRLPALIRGESGSGKERVARALHAWSGVANAPFVIVNCAAIQEQLLEAELFGAMRGAYTGCDRDRIGLLGEADGGTLFLDEIGEMSLPLQAKILRVLDGAPVRALGGIAERRVDVRFVAATHRDLEEAVAAGRFRADLWWRLAMIRIDVPPLRSRLEDLAGLIEALAPELERECERGPLALTDAAFERLRQHLWPGNVRELRGVLARALISCDRLPITPQSIELDESRTPSLEACMIREALHGSAGTITAAAEKIGWSRQKLYRRMEALGIRQPL